MCWAEAGTFLERAGVASRGAAAKVDTIGVQQLCIETIRKLSGAGLLTYASVGTVAEWVKRVKLLVTLTLFDVAYR